MITIDTDVTRCGPPEVHPDAEGCFLVSFRASAALAPVDAMRLRVTAEQLAHLVRLARPAEAVRR